LITRAPKSASTLVHIGADTACSMAMTVMPANGNAGPVVLMNMIPSA
jgi:hypothetical protein